MKRFLTPAETPSASLTVVLLVATLILTSSCIYDAPNDRFYRTLWVCEEPPFNNAEAVSTYGLEEGGNYLSKGGRLTLEFLCDGNITVTATGAVGSYGTYDTYGTTAYFAGLELSYYIGDSGIGTGTGSESGSDFGDGTGSNFNPGASRIVIILEEAHRTDDLLLLSWHFAGSSVSYTTRMVRKGSYD